jgi:hypothetical protein
VSVSCGFFLFTLAQINHGDKLKKNNKKNPIVKIRILTFTYRFNPISTNNLMVSFVKIQKLILNLVNCKESCIAKIIKNKSELPSLKTLQIKKRNLKWNKTAE